ncbi:hypothetical protein PHISP_07304 [Aspergillus sp. HF37]|nr:hypothetical protein PHISP_07304 [Aspergillus sp. HF37]
MRALFTGSTTSPAIGNGADSADTSTPQLSSPPTPAVSVSSADDPLPRQIKSKSSLRSIRSLGSSNHEDEPVNSPDQTASDKELVPPSILRRLSPGLAARMKLLDGSNNKSATSFRSHGAVGRIPEEHIKGLDSLHQDSSIKVERRGRAWHGLQASDQEQGQQLSSSNLLDVSELGLSREEDPTTHPDPEPVAKDADRTATTLVEPEVVPSNEPRKPDADAEPEDTPAAMSVVELSSEPLRSHPEPVANEPEQTDFEKYLQRTVDEEESRRGRPVNRDSRPASVYSDKYSLHRPESIYSFSRISFTNQISELTSISLPQPSTLEATIAGISNAPAAVKALTGSAEQIQAWIKKASDVLKEMNAEDDVEWAAAGGREGLNEVDKAITKFESVVNVYVRAIEEVQRREDIENVSTDSLKTTVVQMDKIMNRWAIIKSRLKAVKEQVELAMEWEELWSNVLGDVAQEVENLNNLVFEMEEKRAAGLFCDPANGLGLDINELGTIVEETPDGNSRSSKRFSMGPILNAAPTLDTPIIQTPQDDSNSSNLMALYARMQPLKASLDFLPMRLSMFHSRAEPIFPSACEELEDRRNWLGNSYKRLDKDVETLRQELGEDRWLFVFRNAGGQARKMFDSVERSIAKLQQGLETGAHVHNPGELSKRMESYETKKIHYVPAIERVVSIIQKGVNDRLTMNGAITGLLSDMLSRTDALKASIKVMDSSLEDINISRSQQLRDSISSIVTMDSPVTGSVAETPGSSPASSVIVSGGGLKGASTPMGGSRRGSSVGSAARTTMPKVRRHSGIPQASSNLSNRKSSSIPKPGLSSPSVGTPATTPTPATRKASRTQPPPASNRPRWNGSANVNGLDTGHNFRPVSPASSRKSSLPTRMQRPASTRPASTIPFRSPMGRDVSASPLPSAPRTTSRLSSRLASRSPGRLMPSPTPTGSILDPPPYSKLRKPPPGATPSTPRNRQSFAATFNRGALKENAGITSPKTAERPGTSLGHSGSRRTSLLPLPKVRGKSKVDERPPWR